MKFHVDKQRLIELWRSEKTNDVIAKELGLTQVQLYVAGRKFGLEQRWGYVRRAYKKTKDPSLEEIAERAAAIRAEWPQGEAERRFVGSGRRDWTPPQYLFEQGILVRAR